MECLAEELLNAAVKAGDTIMVDIDPADAEKLKAVVKKQPKEEKMDAWGNKSEVVSRKSEVVSRKYLVGSRKYVAS